MQIPDWPRVSVAVAACPLQAWMDDPKRSSALDDRRTSQAYSGLIIEKCVCLARFSYSESNSSQEIRLTSAEFRGAIKCDRRK
jgi:hypothetical protein